MPCAAVGLVVVEVNVGRDYFAVATRSRVVMFRVGENQPIVLSVLGQYRDWRHILEVQFVLDRDEVRLRD